MQCLACGRHTQCRGNKTQNGLQKHFLPGRACDSCQTASLRHAPQENALKHLPCWHGLKRGTRKKVLSCQMHLGNAANSTPSWKVTTQGGRASERKKMACSEKKYLIWFHQVFLQAYVMNPVGSHLLIFHGQCFCTAHLGMPLRGRQGSQGTAALTLSGPCQWPLPRMQKIQKSGAGRAPSANKRWYQKCNWEWTFWFLTGKAGTRRWGHITARKSSLMISAAF